MAEGGSLIKLDLGKLAKPATVFIERLSAGFGALYAPTHLVRMAGAEAAAAKMKANAQAEISEIEQRAMTRLLAEETRRQDNIEKITQQAAEQLPEDAKPETMEEDWIANFFDKCRDVSDKEMQSVWARLLAGEATRPGTYSRRTVQLVSTLSKNDAHQFTTLCSFAVMLNEQPTLMILSLNHDPFGKVTGFFGLLTHLQSIGLITLDMTHRYTIGDLPKQAQFRYHKEVVDVLFNEGMNNDLPVGFALLTDSGRELYSASGAQPVPGFVDMLCANIPPGNFKLQRQGQGS